MGNNVSLQFLLRRDVEFARVVPRQTIEDWTLVRLAYASSEILSISFRILPLTLCSGSIV
jgi:hypothetical protein